MGIDEINRLSREIEEQGMKDYIEHEVWVNPNKLIRSCNTYSLIQQEGTVRCTLRIPKPERSVTITEGELRAFVNKIMCDHGDTESSIEEIFGRGDDD